MGARSLIMSLNRVKGNETALLQAKTTITQEHIVIGKAQTWKHFSLLQAYLRCALLSAILF